MKKKGIEKVLLRMTILPLIMLGIVLAVFSIFAIKRTIEHTIEDNLKTYGQLAMDLLDNAYPGEYARYDDKESILITKGDTILNQNYALFDQLKKDTSADYTLFYGDLRVLTTITTADGQRIIGTTANNKLTEAVLEKKQYTFYKNLSISKENYYGYYLPLCNPDGSCIGMLAVLLPKTAGNRAILQVTLPIVLAIIVAFFLTGIWTQTYANSFKQNTRKLQQSLSRVAKGELSNTVPPELLGRDDEFSEMGHSIIEMQKSLRALVEQDALTKLSNRRSGQARLDKYMERYLDSKQEFCLALGDIDFFKKFNDRYGHDCGDLVLEGIASSMQNCIKNDGYCIRWGGEEFLILFPKLSVAEAEPLMEKLLEEIRSLNMDYQGSSLSVTMTFGLCSCLDCNSSDELVKKADSLLYYGKEHGRNQLVLDVCDNENS